MLGDARFLRRLGTRVAAICPELTKRLDMLAGVLEVEGLKEAAAAKEAREAALARRRGQAEAELSPLVHPPRGEDAT